MRRLHFNALSSLAHLPINVIQGDAHKRDSSLDSVGHNVSEIHTRQQRACRACPPDISCIWVQSEGIIINPCKQISLCAGFPCAGCTPIHCQPLQAEAHKRDSSLDSVGTMSGRSREGSNVQIFKQAPDMTSLGLANGATFAGTCVPSALTSSGAWPCGLAPSNTLCILGKL